VALEGWRSEIDIYVSDLVGTDWIGDPVNGQATNDPDANAKYSTQRIYSGLQGFVEFEPVADLSLLAFVRLGLVREIYQGKHYEGSFFVDWGDRPETDVVSFRSVPLIGLGAGGTYTLDKFRIGADFSLAYDRTGFQNQVWFDRRSDGDLSVTTFELRARVGYSLDFIIPRLAVGVFIYSASGEFQEILANNGRNEYFEASFANNLVIQFTAGADIPLSDKVFASLDLAFVAELALRFTLGMKF
jgi:hypothetical protein